MKKENDNKQKVMARKMVSKALKDGKLIKSPFCEECFNHRGITAHHENYNQPLKIVWLCKDCHLERHK